MEAPLGFEPRNRGVADLCLTTWPWRLIFILCCKVAIVKTTSSFEDVANGADYGARTRHLNLGKVALYQMS